MGSRVQASQGTCILRQYQQCGGCFSRGQLTWSESSAGVLDHHSFTRAMGRATIDRDGVQPQRLVNRVAHVDVFVSLCQTCLLRSFSLVYTPSQGKENLTHLLGVITKDEKRNSLQALTRMFRVLVTWNTQWRRHSSLDLSSYFRTPSSFAFFFSSVVWNTRSVRPNF